MLTGQRAFQRPSNIATIAAVSREEPRPLRDFPIEVPPDLERIIRRCLRKAREDRYVGSITG